MKYIKQMFMLIMLVVLTALTVGISTADDPHGEAQIISTDGTNFIVFSFTDADGILSVVLEGPSGTNTIACNGVTCEKPNGFALDDVMGNQLFCNSDFYSNNELEIRIADTQNNIKTVTLDKTNGFYTNLDGTDIFANDGFNAFFACGTEFVAKANEVGQLLDDITDEFNILQDDWNEIVAQGNDDSDLKQAQYLEASALLVEDLKSAEELFNELESQTLDSVFDDTVNQLETSGSSLGNDLFAFMDQVKGTEEWACAVVMGDLDCFNIATLQNDINDSLDDYQDQIDDLEAQLLALLEADALDLPALIAFSNDLNDLTNSVKDTSLSINSFVQDLEKDTLDMGADVLISMFEQFVVALNDLVNKDLADLEKQLNDALFPSGNADLTINNVDFTQNSNVVTTVTAGQSFNVKTTITNSGNVKFDSVNIVITSAFPGSNSNTFLNFNPGETISVGVPFLSPLCTAAGDYQITVKATTLNTAVEKTATKTIKVAASNDPTCQPVPDISGLKIDVITLNPSTVEAGKTFGVKVALKNENQNINFNNVKVTVSNSAKGFNQVAFVNVPAGTTVQTDEMVFTVADTANTCDAQSFTMDVKAETQGKTLAKTATVTVTDDDAVCATTKTDKQKLTEFEDLFEKLEDDYFEFKEDYEEAVDDDDSKDIKDAKNDLKDLEDDLEELKDDVDDLEKDTNDDNVEDDAKDLQEDINKVLDDIDKLLNPEKYKTASSSSSSSSSGNSNSAGSTVTTSPKPSSTTLSSGKIVTPGTKVQPENVQVQVVDTGVTTQPDVERTNTDSTVQTSFTDSPIYLALVIGLIVVLLGLVGFLVAVMVSKN